MAHAHVDPVTESSHIWLSIVKNSKMRQELGTLLRQARRSRGVSTKEIGEAAGVTGQYIGMVERGTRRPNIDTFMSILDALQLSPTASKDGRSVTFFLEEGKHDVTVEFLPPPAVETPAWREQQIIEDSLRLGLVVRILSEHRDVLLEVYRHLGLDDDFNAYNDAMDEWVSRRIDEMRGK